MNEPRRVDAMVWAGSMWDCRGTGTEERRVVPDQ